MPCDTVNTLSVDFNPENESILDAAVKGMGWALEKRGESYVVLDRANGSTVATIQNGKATGNAIQVNNLRMAYTRQVVSVAKNWAKQKGWQVSQKGESRLSVRKGK